MIMIILELWELWRLKRPEYVDNLLSSHRTSFWFNVCTQRWKSLILQYSPTRLALSNTGCSAFGRYVVSPAYFATYANLQVTGYKHAEHIQYIPLGEILANHLSKYTGISRTPLDLVKRVFEIEYILGQSCCTWYPMSHFISDMKSHSCHTTWFIIHTRRPNHI